jgi:prevent-host-death family protein
MGHVSIAEAKARLSEIIARVEAGDTQIITRRGKIVAKIMPVTECGPGRRMDVDALRKLTASMPMSPVSAGEFVSKLRDDHRY